MKSKIQLDDLELIVISKRNRVESLQGDSTIKELVKDYFNKPINVTVCEEESGINTTKGITLKPGNKDYIMAVLIDIRDKYGLRTEYNI